MTEAQRNTPIALVWVEALVGVVKHLVFSCMACYRGDPKIYFSSGANGIDLVVSKLY